MEGKHRIGVLSDTHGLLRPEVLEYLQGCEVILHGGDINRQEILDRLAEIAPVYVVRGNNDKEWAEKLPETLRLELYGVRIFMIYNKKQAPKNLDDVDVMIYGHSHKYEEKREGGRLLLNPGSCGPRRFSQPITMAVLEIADNGEVFAERYDIPHRTEAGNDTKRMSDAKNGVAGNALKETGDSGNGMQRNAAKETGDSGNGMQGNAAKETGDSGNDMQRNAAKENVMFRKAAAGEVSDLRRVIEIIMRDTQRGRSVQEMSHKLQISEELAEQICRLYLTHPGVDADGIMTKMGL